jgi:Sulfotransferase family
MKIFIAGCGRSGTTALLNQLRGLANSVVYQEENHFTELALQNQGDMHIVMKRIYKSYRTLHELPANICLLYCIRHPFDCMTSSHPKTVSIQEFHISPKRWFQEFAGLRRLEYAQPERDICFVRYEDLVRRPHEVESRISGFLGISFEKPFGTYDPLFTSSIGKWLEDSHRRDYLKRLPDKIWPHIHKFAKRFGYDVSLGVPLWLSFEQLALSLLC